MKILITGATGFIGSEVLARLLKSGIDAKNIFVLSRSPLKNSELLKLRFLEHKLDFDSLCLNLGHVQASLENKVDLSQQLEGLSQIPGPWRVLHLAALISTGHSAQAKDLSAEAQKALQKEVNIGSTQTLLEWANRNAELFVFASSVVAFGGSRNFKLRSEKDFPRFLDECREIGYFASKREAHESVLKLAKIPVQILCPGIVHGALEGFKASRGHLKLLRAGKLKWAPPGGGNFVGLDRVAQSFLQAVLSTHLSSTPQTRLLIDQNMSYRDYFNLYLGLYRGTKTQEVREVPMFLFRALFWATQNLPLPQKRKTQFVESLGQSQYFLWFESEFPQVASLGVIKSIQDSFKSIT